MFKSAILVAATLLPLAQTASWRNLPGSLFSPPEPWAYAPDASWPVTTTIGAPLKPQQPDAELEEMLAAIDPQRIKDIVTTLANFGTRHTLSTQKSKTRGIGAARDWILKEMQANAAPSNGKMAVYYNTYIQGVAERISFPVNMTNVVSQINGTSDPNRVYVVTGHYDSRRLDVMDYTGDAPGADDDATGVAVVMELARICATKKPKSTMIFAATAGEEQASYGATNLAQTLKKAGYDVQGNFNNDIVGTGKYSPFSPVNDHTIRLFGASIFYPNATTSSIETEYGLTGGWNDSPAQNLGRFVAEIAAGAVKSLKMQVALIYRPDRYLRGGDHESFLEAGFPAVRFTEAVENFAHQHQDPRMQDGIQYGDLVEFVDFDYTARVARTNLAAMWSAANAPGMPVNVSISEAFGFPAANESTPASTITNESQFCWTTGGDKLVAGYELVWRTTGNLQWQYALDLGMVGSVKVDLPKDDLQFGVRSVGSDGRKSPAVFPLPVASC